SATFVVLNSEKSTVSIGGPETTFLPVLPNVPGRGDANAAVLNHCSAVRGPSLGSPTLSGRSLVPPVPLLSKGRKTSTGVPLWIVTIPLACQPATNFPAKLEKPD